MKVFFTEQAVSELEKLERKSSYQNLRLLFYEFIVANPSLKTWPSRQLNPEGTPCPFYKKRINGSGGYRLYYLLQIVNDEVTISALHPKRGKKGRATLSKEEIDLAFRDAISGRSTKNRILVNLDHDNKNFTLESEQEMIKKEQSTQKLIHTI